MIWMSGNTSCGDWAAIGRWALEAVWRSAKTLLQCVKLSYRLAQQANPRAFAHERQADAEVRAKTCHCNENNAKIVFEVWPRRRFPSLWTAWWKSRNGMARPNTIGCQTVQVGCRSDLCCRWRVAVGSPLRGPTASFVATRAHRRRCRFLPTGRTLLHKVHRVPAVAFTASMQFGSLFRLISMERLHFNVSPEPFTGPVCCALCTWTPWGRRAVEANCKWSERLT